MIIDKNGNLNEANFEKINTARNVFDEVSYITSMFLDCADDTPDGYLITKECLEKVNKLLTRHLQELLKDK